MAASISVRRMLSDLRELSHQRAAWQRRLADLAGQPTPDNKPERRRLLLAIGSLSDRITTLETFLRERHRRDAMGAYADRWNA